MIPITSGLPLGCERRVLAMELKGDATWADEVKTFDRSFYIRFAKLLEAVRTMHERGFVLGDMKGTSVRVKRSDPEFIALDGFIFTFVYMDPSTGEIDRALGRPTNMQLLLYLLLKISEEPPSWVGEFEHEMLALPENVRPDYEKWIAFCRAEALRFA